MHPFPIRSVGKNPTLHVFMAARLHRMQHFYANLNKKRIKANNQAGMFGMFENLHSNFKLISVSLNDVWPRSVTLGSVWSKRMKMDQAVRNKLF